MPRFNPQLPIATTPVWKLTYTGLIYGQRIQNTFFLQQSTGATVVPTNLQVNQAFLAAINPSWRTAFTTDLQGETLKCDQMQISSEVPSVLNAALMSGTVEESADRSIVAVRIYRATNVAGQRGRGMIRVCGTSENDLQDNFVTVGGVARLNALVTALGTTIPSGVIGGGNLIPCLATAVPNPGEPGVNTVRSSPIISWSVGLFTGSQDTRKNGVGR